MTCVAGPGAEDFTQTMLWSGTKVQIVRDGRDHQAAVFASPADSLDWPEPIRHGVLEERAGGEGDLGTVADHGSSLSSHDNLR